MAIQSVYHILKNFKMPGFTVPAFRRKAVVIAMGGVYDPRIHLDDVVMPVLKKWRIFERDGTSPARAPAATNWQAHRGTPRRPASKFEVPSSASSIATSGSPRRSRHEGGSWPGHLGMPSPRQCQPGCGSGSLTRPPSPVVWRPMAGVTNVAFRTLCREFEQQRADTVSGLYVCEMVTAPALGAPPRHHAHDDVRARRIAPFPAALHRRPQTTYRAEDDRRRTSPTTST